MNATQEKFNLLNYISSDKLTVLKEESAQIVCECPVCGGHRLTVNKQTGAYQCWNGCECKDIRDTLTPLPNRSNTPHYQPVRQKIQKPKPLAPPKGDIRLAKLLAPATDIPQPQRDFDREHGEVFKTTYVYSLTPEGQLNRWVIRTDWVDPSKPKGRDKTFRQWHRSESGEAVCKKGDAPWEAYRIDEFIAALKATPGIPVGLVQEGEGVVEKARTDGLASITFQGSAWNPDNLERSLIRVKEECPNAVLAFLRDNDPTGSKKAKDFQEACDRVGIFSVVIDPVAIYSELAHKGDIVEILAAMDTPEFIQRLEEEIHKAIDARQQSESSADSEPVVIPDSLDPDERLKLDLQALLQEPDPIKRMRRRSEIASHYRLKTSDIQEALKHIEQQTTTPEKTCFTFDDFFNQESEAIQWVVPQLLPRGETVLLAAQAKCGKTALATDVMYAVLSGGTVIGDQVGVKGKVLLISSDESPNSTRRRMRLRGFDLLDERSNFRLMTHLDITNLTELESRLEDFRPDLVVIDSLTTICSEVGISEKDPEYARYIYKLKAVLGRYNAACILTHHENKDPLAKGINQISGSSRIPAAVWGILQLKAVDPNNDADPRRFLKIKPREGEATIFNLEMNPKDTWLQDGIWTCHGEVDDTTAQKKTQGDRVLDLLRQYSPKGLTYQEIDNALKIGRSLYQVLDRLEDRQLITKRRSEFNSRQWVYAVPQQGGDTPPPSVDQTMSVEKPESITKKEFQQFNNSFNNNSTPIQQPMASDGVLNSQSPDEASDSTSIQQPDDQRGGEGVLNSTSQVLNPADESAIASQSIQQPESLPVASATDNDVWLTKECLEDMAAFLEACPDSETLADLRQCWPSHALNAACKRLDPETRQRIKAWVLEQNAHLRREDASPDQGQQLPAPASTEFKVGDRVALADPYTVAYSYHGTVEEVAGNEISVRWAERLGLPSECEMYHASELRRLGADEPPF